MLWDPYGEAITPRPSCLADQPQYFLRVQGKQPGALLGLQIPPDRVGQRAAGGLDKVHAEVRPAMRDVPVRLCELLIVELYSK